MKQINKQLKKLTKQIINNYKPEKIILFGSYAWGKPSTGSDVDLFVIKKTKKDPIKRSYELRKNIDASLPLDVLVYTPTEVKKRINLNDFFIKEIINKGKVVYEQR